MQRCEKSCAREEGGDGGSSYLHNGVSAEIYHVEYGVDAGEERMQVKPLSTGLANRAKAVTNKLRIATAILALLRYVPDEQGFES